MGLILVFGFGERDTIDDLTSFGLSYRGGASLVGRCLGFRVPGYQLTLRRRPFNLPLDLRTLCPQNFRQGFYHLPSQARRDLQFRELPRHHHSNTWQLLFYQLGQRLRPRRRWFQRSRTSVRTHWFRPQF